MHIAKPPNCQVNVAQNDNELVLRRKCGNYVIGALLFFLLVVWTRGCLEQTQPALRDPTPSHVFLTVPYWAGWVLLAALVCRLLLAYERLRIGPDGVDARGGVLGQFWRRFVPLHEVRGVAHHPVADHGARYGVKILTWGRPISFGNFIDPDEGRWLADLVIERLRGRPAIRHEADRPPDSDIRLRREPGRLEFSRREAHRVAFLVVVGLVNLTWNGFAIILASELVHHFNWLRLLPLIPFCLVGIFLALYGLAGISEPFRRKAWIITPGEVAHCSSFFGRRQVRRCDLSRLKDIEIRPYPYDPQSRLKPTITVIDEESPLQVSFAYVLRFVSQDDKVMEVIEDLTAGEALWIGAELANLLKGLPGAFIPHHDGPER